MAEKRYEYGMTPEQTGEGILSYLSLIKSPLRDLFTPYRREIVQDPKQSYIRADDAYYLDSEPGKYREPEFGLEYMPVVQGAQKAYEFLGDYLSDPSFRAKSNEALAGGITQLLDDQTKSALNMALTGETRFYDPKQKRVVDFDPLMVAGPSAVAGQLFPVEGAGKVLGMFAGPRADTADLEKLEAAQKMDAEGVSRDEIWDTTGWFKGPEGKWRFEISDDEAIARFNPRVQTPTGRLKSNDPTVKDLLYHPKLFEAYSGGRSSTEMLDSLEDLSRQRLSLSHQLDALRKKYPEGGNEFDVEYARLQEADAELLKKMIEGLPSQTAKPLEGQSPRELRPLISRPVEDIVLLKQDRPSAAASYSFFGDTVQLSRLPGQSMPRRVEAIPWDEKGRYFVDFNPAQFQAHYKGLQRALEKEGISLDSHIDPINPSKSEYSLRKWKGSELVSPEDLSPELRKQWDELINFGTTYYKKDFEPEERFKTDILHEIQHAIQHREGFETGGSPSQFRGRGAPKYRDKATGAKLPAREVYRRLAGEAEARNVETRRKMTPSERKMMPPWYTLDRSEADLILRNNSNE